MKTVEISLEVHELENTKEEMAVSAYLTKALDSYNKTAYDGESKKDYLYIDLHFVDINKNKSLNTFAKEISDAISKTLNREVPVIINLQDYNPETFKFNLKED